MKTMQDVVAYINSQPTIDGSIIYVNPRAHPSEWYAGVDVDGRTLHRHRGRLVIANRFGMGALSYQSFVVPIDINALPEDVQMRITKLNILGAALTLEGEGVRFNGDDYIRSSDSKGRTYVLKIQPDKEQ